MWRGKNSGIIKRNEMKMKINASPNQNLIDFVFIGVLFVESSVSWIVVVFISFE